MSEREWITLHKGSREVLISTFTISAIVEKENYTIVYLANGSEIAVDEDIITVKGEMFL